MDEKELYEMAHKKVQKIKVFYLHFLSYLIVNACLFHKNWNDLSNHLNLAIYWGIGVIGHYILIFKQESSWEKRKIKEIMDKNRNL